MANPYAQGIKDQGSNKPVPTFTTHADRVTYATGRNGKK